MAASAPRENYSSSPECMIETLSADVMTRVLEFSLLPERLNLAMCTSPHGTHHERMYDTVGAY